VARIQTGVKVTPVWIMDIDKGKSQVMIQKKIIIHIRVSKF
jgi:hypothetical protein